MYIKGRQDYCKYLNTYSHSLRLLVSIQALPFVITVCVVKQKCTGTGPPNLLLALVNNSNKHSSITK